MQVAGDALAHAFQFDGPRLARASQLLFGALALSLVASDAGEVALTIAAEFSKRQLERNLSSLLVQTRQLYSAPADVLLTGLYIAFQPGAVNVSQILRHQHGQVLAQHLFYRITEDVFGGAIDIDDGAVGIDRDDSVRGCFRQGAKSRLALA